MNLYSILLLNLWFIQPHAVSAHRSANYSLKFMWAHTRTVVVSGACSDMSHKTAPAWVLKHISGSAHLAFISQTVNKPRLQDPEGHCVKEQHATPSSSLIKQEQNVLSSINQIKDFLDNNSGETNRLTAKRKKGFQKCPKKNVLTELHWHESPCSMCTSHFLSVTNSS